MAVSAAVDTWGSAPDRGRAEVFLPLVVFPRERRAPLEASANELCALIRRYLPRAGALLFRGFRVSEDGDFDRFVAATSELEPPAATRVWAWCAGYGQRVTLADRRELYRAVPASVRRRWAERALAYARRDERGRLLLARRLAPVALHPRTCEALWAQPEHSARAGAFGCLLGVARGGRDGDDANASPPWTVAHGDGSPLDELDVHEVNAAVESCRSEVCLEARDVLLLDPSLMAHGLGANAAIAVRREGALGAEESSTR